MTYKQAYDKIIDAYFKDEIKPMNCDFCFCGTLSKDGFWWLATRSGEYPYSHEEYTRMEAALLREIKNKDQKVGILERGSFSKSYETDLFAGMSAALEVLKQIHIERGEIIDEVPAFTKRELVTSK